MARGLQAVSKDLSIECNIVFKSDASAAIAIASKLPAMTLKYANLGYNTT